MTAPAPNFSAPTKESFFIIAFFFLLQASLFSQPVDLPWSPDPTCNSIITTGIVAVTCGTTVDVAEVDRYTFGLIDLNGALPAAGRIDVTLNQDVYHHPAWHIDSIGNVFGITMDDCGNTYIAASANYASLFFTSSSVLRYGDIGGGVDDLSAAGTVYKIDYLTGQPTVFSVLPQQLTDVVHMGCEGSFPQARQTGPGLGNLVYSSDHDMFYVTNFEDGRIYRLDGSGSILDSYDPFEYDDGLAGPPTDGNEIAYGIDINGSADSLFFGNFGPTTGNTPNITSIPLNSDGSFVGTVDNTNLPSGATWDNYVGTETDHYDVNIVMPFTGFFSISDLEFTPSGDLLVGARIGCMSSPFTSYNHGGTAFLLSADMGLYSNLEGIIYTGCMTCALGAGNESYGGVSVFENPNGTNEFVISSGDLLSDPLGPHGIVTQAEGVFGSANNPASPAGIISYGTVDDGFDPKGIGGDVKVFRECFCQPVCPDSIFASSSPAQICSADTVQLGYTLSGGNVMVDAVWTNENGDTISPTDLVLTNPDCAPQSFTFMVTGVCQEDSTVVLTDMVTVEVFNTQVSPFVNTLETPCEVDLSVDSACLGFFEITGSIPTINPGDSGAVTLIVSSTDPLTCAVDSFELQYNCPECEILEITADVSECEGDLFLVSLNLQAVSTGSTFSVTDQDGTDLGMFNYADLPVELGPFVGDTNLTYVFTIQDDSFNFCMDTVQVIPPQCIGQCGEFDIPNIFTPNGDGVNDFFYIVAVNSFVEVLEFKIFNRWGELIHDDVTPWNGQLDEKDHNEEVFVYLITVDTRCGIVKMQGDVTLIR